MNIQELNKELGNIDLYLLDQLLKGRYTREMKILDAGCGEGRNLVYFMNNGYDVYGVDPNPMAIKMLKMLSKNLGANRFVESSIETMPYPIGFFDAIICNAVLHFADSHEHFLQIFDTLMDKLKNGGSIFIRMTTDIGLPDTGEPRGKGIFNLPDGSIRYLLTRDTIQQLQKQYDLRFLEPVKAINVQDSRSMATLMMQKGT